MSGRKLGLSQPSLSRLLARLREHFKDPLLKTVGRGMERTVFAHQLQPRLTRAIEALRELSEPARLPHEQDQLIRIAAADHAVLMVLEPWLRKLRVEAPLVRARIAPLSVESIGLLLAVDASTASPSGSPGRLISEHLIRNEFATLAGS